MLDSETKRHIDAARQVLVGVVPNPTSQVEQITNALLYKFMDDMDQAAIKVGGKPSFFTDDLEHYAWARIMRPGVGNQERMNLYSEALTKFSQAKQLPELFRDIFADAFLPHRSPETLGLFLKEIDYFDYSHPEELGNAYEYLLLIMASQGDAGQFRTPRHIIDFIVDVVNPTKDDKILDPACGTGGFLVSSYRRILEQHDGKNDPEKKEKRLTPDERRKLMNNLEGYDIDPGMARIARVNMYLHQFKNPRIHRYDTLSSDERWRDKFSVIMANPPFMSPKGGIRPHDRFSIKSSRSEVLFVDYIMSHLRPSGRAGIIVPEGIIFQSSTAYKELREKLIKDGLYAVVSLPGGVFQPYSGVKTSILLFNNEIAKLRDEILFMKVENDGFALGATRQPINKNDLPVALDILNRWLTGEKSNSKLALYVEKTKISESGDYNLSGDRYRETVDYSNVKWPIVELREVCTIKTGKKDVNQGNPDGEYPFFTCAKEHTFSDSYSFDTEALLIAGNGDVGAVKHFKGKFEAYQRTYVLLNFENVDPKYLYGLLSCRLKETVSKQKLGNTMPYIKLGMLQLFKIPLPPLEVQKQIATEIDQHQKVIDGAKQVVQNWKPSFRIDSEWEIVELRNKELFKIESGGTPNTKKPEYWSGAINWVTLIDLPAQDYVTQLRSTQRRITEDGLKNSSAKLLPKGSILISSRATIGRIAINKIDVATNQGFKNIVILDKNRVNAHFLALCVKRVVGKLESMGEGSTYKEFSKADLSSIEVPLPPLKVQLKIVGEIEAEQEVVDGCKALIATKENKINTKIAEVWGE